MTDAEKAIIAILVNLSHAQVDLHATIGNSSMASTLVSLRDAKLHIADALASINHFLGN